MFISKKKFNEAIAEAQEKAIREFDKMHWQQREIEELRMQIHDLVGRLDKVENKGKKPRFRCPFELARP